MKMLKCYQRIHSRHYSWKYRFLSHKTTETSQNSLKSQNLMTLWFSRRFPGKIEKKNRFSRSFQEDLKFPGFSRSVATLCVVISNVYLFQEIVILNPSFMFFKNLMFSFINKVTTGIKFSACNSMPVMLLWCSINPVFYPQ